MSKVLIVTGASRGIGAATARLAARDGWQVVTSYLQRAEPAEAVVQQIRKAGGQAITVQADTSKPAEVVRLFDTAEREFGTIAGLVNNAGINGGPTTLADMPFDEMHSMMATNVVGVMLCAQEAVRRMSTARGGAGGAIVNLGSVAARLGGAGERVHYAASKGAVISFTAGLAREVIREGIRVNCVSPGLIDTEMNPAERLARLVPGVPIARAGQPEEIAETILFLLSPASSYIIGIDVAVSGGR